MKNKWYINKVYINNFKPFPFKMPLVEISFQDTDEQLASYTMLSGPNGYGKTTLFQAIEFAIMGKIDIWAVKDKTRIYSEHIAINQLGKESIIAIEFINLEGNKVSLIRYNKKTEACSEVDCKSEWKGYEVFLIQESFVYEKFKREMIDGKLESTTNDEIQKMFNVNKLSEWIDFNYIQQEQSNNLVFKDNTNRVNFVNTFIDKQEDGYNKYLNEKVVKLDIEIKKLKSEILELKRNVTTIENASIGKMPEPIIIFKESKYIWDKEEYNSNECLVDYITTVNQMKEVLVYSDIYSLKSKISKFDTCLKSKEKLGMAIINKYFKEQQYSYISKYKAHNYYKQIKKNDLLKINLSIDYLEQDFIDEIKRLKDDKISVDSISGEEEKMFQIVHKVRDDLLVTPIIVEKVFENICPLCGTKFSDEKLITKIENYKNSFAKIEKKLNENIIVLNNSITNRLNKLNGKIENFIKNSECEEDIYNKINNLQSETEGVDKIIKLVDELIGLEWINDDKFSLDSVNLEKYTNELFNKLFHEKNTYVEKMNRHKDKDGFKEELYQKHQDFILDINKMPIKIEKKLDEKIEYLDWLIKKKQLDQSFNNKEMWVKKSKELTQYLTQKFQINLIINEMNKAKKMYLEDLAKFIEIPLYIYSGKLLQTHQNNLGVFCNTGKKIDQLTQFKLTTTGDNEAHDILNKFSSGQKAVLNIALILAFRKIKDNVLDVFMIDDPCQSLDDINIASLTEILCKEFDTTQIIMSTHDEDTAGYMCYKYYKSGKAYRNLNIQKELYKLNVE